MRMRSTLVPMMLDHAARHDAPVLALAERFEVPPPHRSMATWSLELGPLDLETAVGLAQAIADALDDPALGIHMAAEVPRGVYGVQEFALRNAPTLGEAAKRLERYQRLTNDVIRNESAGEADRSWVGFRIPDHPSGLGPHLDSFLLALTLRFVRDLGGSDVTPSRVELTHGRSAAPLPALVECFGCEDIRFGAGRSALIFGPEVWNLPILDADPALLPVLEAYAEKLMPRAAVDSLGARVREHLRLQLSGGAPTVDAAAMGMTVRTLQRRLREEEGVSYRDLVDALREAEGRRLMAQSDLPIDEVSFLLGFSARRAFSRAFTRWTGTTPGRYRDEHR